MRGIGGVGIRRRGRRSSRWSRARNQQGFGLVEMLIASTIGGIGILAVAGLQLAAATQGRIAQWRTHQALVAQEVFEEIQRQGYAAATSGQYTASVDGTTYRVSVSVVQTSVRVKQVMAQVPAMGTVNSQMFVTRIYEPRPVPAAP